MTALVHGRAQVHTVELGAKRDGTITAAQAYLAFEAGAYPGSPVGAGAQCAFAPYDIANQVVDGFDVVVNGHDHDYERFAPMDAAGNPDSAGGVREFVVGTGGAVLRG